MSQLSTLNYAFLNKNIHLFLKNKPTINANKQRQIMDKCYYYATLRSYIPQDINGYAYLGAFILSSSGNVYSNGYNKL